MQKLAIEVNKTLDTSTRPAAGYPAPSTTWPPPVRGSSAALYQGGAPAAAKNKRGYLADTATED
jgi:hypothetical protein